MGKVVLAHDERIGREIAVKELHATRTLTAQERVRFVREARVQGQLEHPSIVPVYDIDRRPDGTVFFTMRRVLGRTLQAILADLRDREPVAVSRFTQRELLSAFATVCLAVEYAHSRGVIHRDLKPANIMLGDFGEVYVLDWGLARLLGESAISDEPAPRLSTPGELMGTPLYMAPEQVSDPDVGVSADVYALGAILFELLTLVPLRDPRAPFMPQDARPSERAPARGIAPELETICVTATRSDPEDRFPSTRALHQAVTRFLEGDRELEQRRQLAANHARAARAALAKAGGDDANHEVERGKAMRELTRALAFEPTNGDYLALLAELIATPPRTLPPEIREELRAENQQVVRLGTKASINMVLSWIACLPVLAVLGIRDWWLLLYIAVPVTVSVIASGVSLRRRVIGPAIQCVAIGFVMVGAAGTSHLAAHADRDVRDRPAVASRRPVTDHRSGRRFARNDHTCRPRARRRDAIPRRVRRWALGDRAAPGGALAVRNHRVPDGCPPRADRRAVRVHRSLTCAAVRGAAAPGGPGMALPEARRPAR